MVLVHYIVHLTLDSLWGLIIVTPYSTKVLNKENPIFFCIHRFFIGFMGGYFSSLSQMFVLLSTISLNSKIVFWILIDSNFCKNLKWTSYFLFKMLDLIKT